LESGAGRVYRFNLQTPQFRLYKMPGMMIHGLNLAARTVLLTQIVVPLTAVR
jgi:hypothetical protein